MALMQSARLPPCGPSRLDFRNRFRLYLDYDVVCALSAMSSKKAVFKKHSSVASHITKNRTAGELLVTELCPLHISWAVAASRGGGGLPLEGPAVSGQHRETENSVPLGVDNGRACQGDSPS